MDTITESTLAEFIDNGAVAGITIKETSEGFRVLVSVQWDAEKQLVLITQRTRKPQQWSNLDRLVRHLTKRFPNLPTLKLEARTKHASGTRARKPKEG